jgi:iron complex outermembrane receptor protein
MGFIPATVMSRAVPKNPSAPTLRKAPKIARCVNSSSGFLSLKAGYNHTRGQQLSGENLPFIPQNRLRTEIRWNSGKLLNQTSLYIKLGSELALSQDNPSEFELASETYHLMHLGAGIAFPLKGESASIDLAINNLMNTPYMDHLSVLREWDYYNMGRNISISLRVPFSAGETSM